MHKFLCTNSMVIFYDYDHYNGPYDYKLFAVRAIQLPKIEELSLNLGIDSISIAKRFPFNQVEVWMRLLDSGNVIYHSGRLYGHVVCQAVCRQQTSKRLLSFWTLFKRVRPGCLLNFHWTNRSLETQSECEVPTNDRQFLANTFRSQIVWFTIATVEKVCLI